MPHPDAANKNAITREKNKENTQKRKAKTDLIQNLQRKLPNDRTDKKWEIKVNNVIE